MSLLKKIQVEKNTSKKTNRASRDKNANKTTVLLSHPRNKYAFIEGQCCYSPTHSSYLQHNLALIKCSDETTGLSQRET